MTNDNAAEGFGPVVDAFKSTVNEADGGGAALSIWVEGQPVVEIQTGVADASTGRPWTEKTVTATFSCTKGIASLLVAMLIEQGSIPSLDVPLSTIWPEFGTHGKEDISLGDALAHRAGVSAPREDLAIDRILDGVSLAAALAAQEPLWHPGSHHQYHTVTHGVITEQVIARVSGRSIGRFLADEVTGPLGADMWIGLPEQEHHRLGRLVQTTGADDPVAAPMVATANDADQQAEYWVDRAANFAGPVEIFADPNVIRSELAGAGGIASATGLARIWSAAVTPTAGLRLIGPATAAAISAPRSVGRPYFGGEPPFQSWGAGVMIPSPWEWYLTPRSFGHDGAGGQVAFADPEATVGFAYLTNVMGDWQRGQHIVDILRTALE